MAAAFGAEVSSPASRWQLRPSLTFDYGHGDIKQTATEDILGLESMPTLEVLWLSRTSVTDVRHLASAKALKQLHLSGTKVTTEGTMGLESIPTLETLSQRHTSVTDVRHLASAKALKLLDLGNTKVTTKGTKGLESIPTLESLLLGSTLVYDVRHLASAKALKLLDLGNTKVTTKGTKGLESIPTLESLLLGSTLVTDVRHLASAKALKQLALNNTKVTTEGTKGLELIPTLETLELSHTSVTDVRHLASAKVLQQLVLRDTKATTEGTMGLESIPTLETLDLSGTLVKDVRHLASAKALKKLVLSNTTVTTQRMMGLESIPTLETLDLSGTLVKDVRHLASAKALKKLVLSNTKVTTERMMGLESIPTLEELHLWYTPVTDVRHLASAKALKLLDLGNTKVTTKGTKGLESIPTLESLLLGSTSVTDVRHLAPAKVLKKLVLRDSKVTTEGTMGLECIPTLESLHLVSTSVTNVRHLASAKALKQLDISNTKVTTEGTKGLERIPTLQDLDLSATLVTDMRHLASSKKLKYLNLRSTKVTTEGTKGLERIPTLQDLDLSATLVTDMRHLASSKKLKYLNLRSTKVTTEGTKGLESIPTLEGLDLSSTPITSVLHLASAKNLTWLCLVHTKVATEYPVRLERAVEAGTRYGIGMSELEFATAQIDREDAVVVLHRSAYKRSSFVVSYETLPFGSVFASGGSAQIRSVAGRPEILAKIYHHHVLGSVEGYQRETDILQSLRHDYIISIRGLIKDDAVVRGYLMEAMDGNLLNTTLTPEQRLVALRQCAEGLSYAHSRDITHGDVKPENCLVRVRNGVVTAKVCDFGMARVLSTMASTTIHGGTVLYTAPEGNTHPKAADVFAFGLTMWMVLSAGHDHGLGNSIADVMRGIAEGRRPPLDIPSLQALPSSDSVCELLQQCWGAASTRRPTMAEVMLELQIILRSVPLAVSSPEPPLPATSSLTWSRSQRYRVSSSLAADHDLFQRVASLLHLDPSLSRCCVRRVQLVQHDDRDVFWRIHRAEAASLKRSEYLRATPPTTAAAKAASAVLDTFAAKAAPHLQTLANVPTADGNGGLSRIVFACFGTSVDRLDSVCRDGLRALRVRDDGFFGNGVYLAMEADYARRYAREEDVTDDQQPATLILYACSISQTYPVTLEADYRHPTEDMGRDDCGYSRFYDGAVSRPLEAKYDAHFVPVRDCGPYHPWDGVTPVYGDLDYQAATEQHPNPALRPTAHELVLSNSLRCTPVALVEVGPSSRC
jgi:serine/threonine protein kinase